MSLRALTRVMTACSALAVLSYGSLAHAGNGPTTMTRALAGAHGGETTAATRITRSLPGASSSEQTPSHTLRSNELRPAAASDVSRSARGARSVPRGLAQLAPSSAPKTLRRLRGKPDGWTPAAVDVSKRSFVEGYPRDVIEAMRFRGEVLNQVLPPGQARGVISAFKIWSPYFKAIKVCFFGGSQELRARIAKVASQWSEGDVHIPLDFGDMADPRECSDLELNHIRVGFAKSGYWSYVGMDSLVLSRQSDQSMNLGGFDKSPPDKATFERVVLHEFGHALGLKHEHQNPMSVCQDEFNWALIYDSLQGEPNNWTKDQIDFNMRSIQTKGLIAEEFDKKSIMLYTFPVQFYIKGQESPCYSEYTSAISDGDRKLMERMYPKDPLERFANFKKRIANIKALVAEAKTDEETKTRGLDLLGNYLSDEAPQ